jgi:DUF4097 and DUF4098 domain-containing protein YvlB
MVLVLAFASMPFAYDGTLRRGATLEIRDVNGNVRVRTGDRFAIRATKHGERDDPAQVRVRVETAADRTVVCVRYPPDADRACADREEVRDNDVEVDLDVTVPHGVVLEANTVNGWVDARNDGPIPRISTVNGYVNAEGTGVGTVQTVNGRVDVRVLGPAHGELSAKTVNGDVSVALPPNAGAQITAKTLNGDIRVGLPVERPRYGPGASVHGTVGDGALDVRLESLNGNIVLRR